MTDLSLMRIIAQGLVPATSSESAHDVVRRMLATQGQLPSAVPHSLITRTRDATGSGVRAHFENGDLVRSWPFRGTLHIVAAEDHHWVRALSWKTASEWWNRMAQSLALTERDTDRARTATRALLAAGPQPRGALRRLWLEEGIARTEHDGDQARAHRLLVAHLHRDGTIVSGPPAPNDHQVMDASALPEARSPRTVRLAEGDPGAAREARAEIARRYAASRGPVTDEDLARWMGTGKGVARRALDDAVDAGQAPSGAPPGPPLIRAVVERGRIIAVGQSDASQRVYYLRADLPDLLAENREAAKRTHYLAAFDELHVGYKDRTCLADAAAEDLVCPGKNGMFRPLLVDGGRVVAVNPSGLGLLWAKDPSGRLATDVDRAIRRIESRLAR